MQDLCVISLGGDCSVSYQLRRLGLQARGTMPFDWMRIDKLADVISILEAEFNDFAKFDSYTINQQSLAFEYFATNVSANVKSQYKMIHKKYKFILPHEYQGDYIDQFQFEAKYARRIKRFLEIGKDSKIHKVFVRLGTLKEQKLISKLEAVLDGLGIVNYEIKYIVLEEWNNLIPKDMPFRWQRDYIPWIELLTYHLSFIKSRISNSIICSSRGDIIRK